MVWRLRIESRDALSLNFGFTKYRMPAGGRMLIYPAGLTPSADPKLIRTFTAADNDAHGQLWTPIVVGDQAVIEVVVPRAKVGELKLQLAKVNHDYVGFGRIAKQDIASPAGQGHLGSLQRRRRLSRRRRLARPDPFLGDLHAKRHVHLQRRAGQQHRQRPQDVLPHREPLRHHHARRGRERRRVLELPELDLPHAGQRRQRPGRRRHARPVQHRRAVPCRRRAVGLHAARTR